MEDNVIKKYFEGITKVQEEKFLQFENLFREWNEKINLVSRKDIDNLQVHHILHSLSIAKIIDFTDGTFIVDVGTGGGLPGIPLAIMFPNVQFLLVDSVAKKITAAGAIVRELKLDNVETQVGRVESMNIKCDFAVSRAVTTFPEMMNFLKGKFLKTNKNTLPNGLIYLKGGDYMKELNAIDNNYRIFRISDFFQEEYFATKEIVWVRYFL